MGFALGFLAVLLALISTGHALSCIQCASRRDPACNGHSVSCPSDNVCGASYTVATDGFSVSRDYVQSCVPKKQCNLKGSTSVLDNVLSRMGARCCYTDNCTPPLIALPDESRTFNGLVCRTCVSAGSDWCYSNDTMRCTGNEKMCVLQTTSITAVSMTTAVRGCATKSLCDLGRQFTEIAGQKVDVKFNCTSGTAGLYSGLTLSFNAILIANIFS